MADCAGGDWGSSGAFAGYGEREASGADSGGTVFGQFGSGNAERGIRQAQWFGLAEAFPQLVREALGSDPKLRKEALRAIRSIAGRFEDRRVPVEAESEAQSARWEHVYNELYEKSGAKEIYELFDHAEVALEMHHAPADERMAYLRGLMGELVEDGEYGPEDIPGGCGFGVGGGPEEPLRFLATRHRKEFVALAKGHLADTKANNRGELIDLIREAKLEVVLEAALRPLMDHPRTGIRVPALAAMARRLTFEELKKRLEDSSGAVRVTVFWELDVRDGDLAIRTVLPQIAAMVKAERNQVLGSLLHQGAAGRKWLEVLARHADKKVAMAAREVLREMDEGATYHPSQNAS